MSGYEKKIVYFDLMENGEKIGNAGFVKVIVQSGQLRLMTNISGLHKTDTLSGELILLQEEEDVCLDTLYMKEGQCVYSRLFTGEELNQLQVCWGQAFGIALRLGENRCLKALWKPEVKKEKVADWSVEKSEVEEPADEEQVAEGLAIEAPVVEGVAAEELAVEQLEEEEPVAEKFLEPQLKKVEQVDNEVQEENEEPIEKEVQIKAVPIKEEPQIEKVLEDRPLSNLNRSAGRILDDKWKQLEQVFSHIHPFGDAREYLSVTPKDFIVLTREYQCLANNSFLLHGFYNYHHIILGKMTDGQDRAEKQEKFYLGVPGVYYEREKAVALMFGFESFECAKEPAATGTFGYYMKRVEI